MKKPRRIVVTLELETSEYTVRDLSRLAFWKSADGDWLETSAAFIVPLQVSANAIKPEKPAAKARKR